MAAEHIFEVAEEVSLARKIIAVVWIGAGQVNSERVGSAGIVNPVGARATIQEISVDTKPTVDGVVAAAAQQCVGGFTSDNEVIAIAAPDDLDRQIDVVMFTGCAVIGIGIDGEVKVGDFVVVVGNISFIAGRVAAEHAVVAGSADERIVCRAAIHDVIARSAVEQIFIAASAQRIIPASADQDITAARSFKRVGTVSTLERVILAAAADKDPN